MTDPAVSPFDLIREALRDAEIPNDPLEAFLSNALYTLDQLQRDHEALTAERGEADPRLTVEHVERLERRIKEQRDHITRLIGMREPGDRYTRKRMAALERALGRVSLGAEKLKEDFAAYRARTDADLDAAVREAETLREALRQADEAVSAAHDVVWAPYPAWEGEAGRREPLNASLWRLHEILRAALASSRDTTETT